MAYTIQASFERFRQNLEISDLQTTTVSTRQRGVRDAIESSITLVQPSSFLTGSYKRNTMIAPLKEADVDIFFTLDSSYFHHYDGKNGGQAGLLDWVKRVLLKTYTSTPDVSRNGQAVTIRFSDFAVDVVPGFHRKNGGYLIPNSVSGTWISTDPEKHVEQWSAFNQEHDGDFVRLVKMLKAWNRNSGKYFRSFHLEVLARQILTHVVISDFSTGARYFFDKGRVAVTQSNMDPAGYGGDVGAYLNTSAKIRDAVALFEKGYNSAVRAEEFSRQGHDSTAIGIWRSIFGDYFPAYG